MVAVFKWLADEVNQRIIFSQYIFPENQRAIVVHISLFQSSTLQHACYVFLHPFFIYPFQGLLVHMPWINFVWIFRSLLPYWLLKETHKRLKKALFWIFLARHRQMTRFQKKYKITLSISLIFSNISNMQLSHNEIWYFAKST